MRKLILIGSSTGGPGHIEKILSSLPKDFDATIIIAQHMGDEYLPSFATRLDRESKLKVSLAENGQEIKSSHIYICTKKSEIQYGKTMNFIVSENMQSNYNPSINALFDSAVNIDSSCEILAIILTGIGDDGVKGIKNLSGSGRETIAESHKSAVVYGMPKRAAEAVKEIKVLSLDEIINYINKFGA
ncbi:CheB methylesterase domain-containing protein [Sulfurimonas sp. HSL-1716]|uniref:CheB methylesterase domain-containing protein n=1 Tax=Hydrocurvibacter sulfurireducens TaxID=3131937 RepID=UPI0031F777E9